MHLVERPNTSRGVYPIAAFMTIFALHPEAFIQEWLLQRPPLLTGTLRYVPYDATHHAPI